MRVHLELRAGRWYPEDSSGEFRDVYAFAEEGKTTQVPGPMIRAASGTEVRVSVKNTLGMDARIYGLHQHPGDAKAGIAVAAGETKEVDFRAGEPGTYLYWATTSGKTMELRAEAETTLSGALIVDVPDRKTDDRVFVIGYWTARPDTPAARGIPWINGKSWPFTERLNYKTGGIVHWRVINTSFEAHAMHLHGFYFDVEGIGDGERYEGYAKTERPKVVTERIDQGHTFEMNWTPERPGNWLFHCHMVTHMGMVNLLHPADGKTQHVESSEGSVGMGGLVVGVTVLPKEGEANTEKRVEAAHKLQLVIEENPGKTPFYKLEVDDPRIPAKKEEKNTPPYLMGPPIFLTRGETTEIEVKNETKDPTSIHWHGIEIENYYDGVAGWSGDAQRTAPAVAPGGSFVARLTPPRAGTFIYHSHWHDRKQIHSGVYGPLIVLEPGEKYDPEHDRTILISEGNYAPFGDLLLINGGLEPDPMQLQSGTRYKLRLINISADTAQLHLWLKMGDEIAQWRIVAIDGANLPAGSEKTVAADMDLTVGSTADVELQMERKGTAQLEISEPLFFTLIAQPLTFQ